MIKPVIYPLSPIRTRSLILGQCYVEELQTSLEKLDIRIIPLPPNHKIDSRLACHADLSAVYLGNSEILLSSAMPNSFAELLQQEGLRCRISLQEQGSKYPFDSNLNCVLLNKLFLGNLNIADPMLKALAENKETVLHVNQGYARCSTCIVNEYAFITADAGIYKALSDAGYDVLKINPGGIILPGFDYGFIGGASFKISENQIAFTGHLNNHPSKAEIIDFLNKHGVKPVFLTSKPIFDIGSAIQISEY